MASSVIYYSTEAQKNEFYWFYILIDILIDICAIIDIYPKGFSESIYNNFKLLLKEITISIKILFTFFKQISNYLKYQDTSLTNYSYLSNEYSNKYSCHVMLKHSITS